MSHWTTHPALDPRAVPPSARGIRAPGHTGTPETCAHAECADVRAAREVARLAVAEKRGTAGAAASKRAAERAGVTHRELLGGASRPTQEPQIAEPPTVREIILLAASDVAAQHAGAVPVGPLVVRAWEIAPARFGLPGHEGAHPHSSRVLAKLSGEDGLVALGWLATAGASTWRLTARGARLARELRRRAP